MGRLPSLPEPADMVVIGGGFYGCCLALYFQSGLRNVILLEAEAKLLTRASFANQARVHTGFHYPRSFATAKRSLMLHRRFCKDFSEAVVDDFQMLYAIARDNSKISPQRFERMFTDMGGPIAPASDPQKALFDFTKIAAVFRCDEAAFDAVVLRQLLRERLEHARVDLRLNARVTKVESEPGANIVTLADGSQIAATHVVNSTYGAFAAGEMDADFQDQLKHERAEIVLIDRPPELAGLGVTVMDGPFFSVMPFPACDCYSLTHVRYTPQRTWRGHVALGADTVQDDRSKWIHMQRDAARYMPCLRDVTVRQSLFETKTVLARNEGDDGRPILVFRNSRAPNYTCVLGGKLDNIYDLLTAFGARPEYAGCIETAVASKPAAEVSE